jgi:hypothetical protein
MTKLERAVLASFILLPLPANQKGRRAGQIFRCTSHSFRRCIRSYPDPLYLVYVISTCCRKLVKLGLLERVGTVPHTFTVPAKQYRDEPIVRNYESPIYRPTESGFAQALSFCDHTKLAHLRIMGKHRKQNPYRLALRDVATTFLHSIE